MQKWRPFCEKFKDVVEDYSFGTLLRLDHTGEYSELNSILVTRIQFYAIELSRNREGLNDCIRSKFKPRKSPKSQWLWSKLRWGDGATQIWKLFSFPFSAFLGVVQCCCVVSVDTAMPCNGLNTICQLLLNLSALICIHTVLTVPGIYLVIARIYFLRDSIGNPHTTKCSGMCCARIVRLLLTNFYPR